MTTQLKIEAGKKYRTRGGDEVEVLRTDLKRGDPVLAVLTSKVGGYQEAVYYYSDGSYCPDERSPSDLISEIKPKRVVWMNVYQECCTSYGFSTREEADDYAGDGRIACVRVEFEEGQFDE